MAEQARDAVRKEAEETAELSSAETAEHKVEEKTVVLKAAIEEAVQNVNDALRFIKMVKSGDGRAAYERSFLSQEHKEHGVGGVGGFAQLSGEQLNIPWLVKLNQALSTA